MVGDIRNLDFADASFDAVVAYGGPVSYVREDYGRALDELARVCRPGGVLVLSVMSLWGTHMLVGSLDAEHFLATAEQHVPWPGLLAAPGIVLTVPGSDEFHLPMALFSSTALRAEIEGRRFDVLRMAAANPISRIGLSLERVAANEEAAARLEALELAMCEHPGLVDSGEHLIVVGQKGT